MRKFEMVPVVSISRGAVCVTIAPPLAESLHEMHDVMLAGVKPISDSYFSETAYHWLAFLSRAGC